MNITELPESSNPLPCSRWRQKPEQPPEAPCAKEKIMAHILALLLAILLSACAAPAPPPDTTGPPCDFARIAGDLFEFVPSYPGGERHGYYSWKNEPNATRRLPYFDYVGRKGKLTAEIVSAPDSLYRKAVLENCEVVYVQTSREYPVYYGAVLAKDLERARSLIGRPIWGNNSLVRKNLELITANPRRSYPMHNLEKLFVTGVVLEQYEHALGAGSFFLKVRKATGEEGLLKFNDQYFYESDPLPAGTPAEIRKAIEEKKVRAGMSAEQAILSWGKPQKVNRSTGNLGVSEQWLYGTHTLHFENGRLTRLQSVE
jgi:hypothetical protein